MKKRKFLTRIKENRIYSFVSEIPEALFAIVLIGLVLLCLYFYEKPEGFIHNQFPGLMLDIGVFGILIIVFNKFAERRRDIKRWKEEIDDYRNWPEPEATYRIMGIVRRLNARNVTNIDLSYCYLYKAYLGKDPQRLVDKTEGGLSPEDLSRIQQGYLVISDAAREKEFIADLRGANLTKTNLNEAFLIDVKFNNAKMYRANLQGALLFWTNLSGANLRRADLRYASFGSTILENTCLIEADLRGARVNAQMFRDVFSLYKAKLDPNIENQIKEIYPQLLEKPYKNVDDEEAGPPDSGASRETTP